VKLLLALLCTAILATGAMAQGDNTIGVFFDVDNMLYCTDTQGNSMGYVVLMNVTYTSVYAWEASMTVENMGLAGFVNHVGVPEGVDGLQIGTYPNIIMAFASPLAGGPAVVVGQFEFGYYGSGEAQLTLGANDANPSIPGQIAVQTGPSASDIVPFTDWADGLPCAYIGVNPDDCVVAADEVSFGAVKALYR
jgi:hypothetical protein